MIMEDKKKKILNVASTLKRKGSPHQTVAKDPLLIHRHNDKKERERESSCSGWISAQSQTLNKGWCTD